MIAESQVAPNSATEPQARHDDVEAALAGVLATTRARHASALRYDATRSQLVVAGLAGVAILALGSQLPAPELADLVADDGDTPVVPPAVEALAAAAGMHHTLAVPLHHERRIEGLLYVAWDDTTPPLTARTALGTVEWHIRHITRALIASAASSTRVVVAHEDGLVADGVARRLERRGGFGLLTASSLAELRQRIQRDAPAIVLCSDSLGAGRGLHEVVADIRGSEPQARLVLLTRTATPSGIAQARAVAAHGLVALDDGAPQLLPVVDAVVRGETGVPPTPAVPARNLSRRELQILQGLDEGLTYLQIATRVGVSVSTAKTQSRSLFRKLDVNSRGAAVHRARSEGLL